MQPRLRAVRPGDLPAFFEHQADAEAADIAGVTPRSRLAFDEHWHRILATPGTVVRTVEVDGAVAGYVSAFLKGGRSEIAYWLGREHWREGIGRAAVSAFLGLYANRPVFGSVLVGNIASLAILRRCGFVFVAEETGADGLRERVFRLDEADGGAVRP